MSTINVLFLDDRQERIEKAKILYADKNLTAVTNVKECLRKMAWHEYNVISLDHDLDGHDFQSPDEDNCGMAIIRYIQKTGWPPEKAKPKFLVHSTNKFAANKMRNELIQLGFYVELKPFGWKQYQQGVIAGAFDVIHVGYAKMIAEAREICHEITIALHDKPGTIFEIGDRKEILLSMRGIRDVLVYEREDELTTLLESGRFDVRFVGDDHKGSSSRPNIKIDTVYISRDHGWSRTKFIGMILDANTNGSQNG